VTITRVALGQRLPAGLEVLLASRKLGGLIVAEVNPTTIPAASSPVWSTIRSRRPPDSQLGPRAANDPFVERLSG
jgi:hypothetical protein